MKTNPTRLQPKGFALIVTLSLMILLTVIAVGLLTLSTITLRSSGQGSAQAIAQANARMALMLAIGELQKTTGPDRAITAPATIVDQKHPFGVTGVWTPWLAGSAPSSRNKTAREGNFKQWLVSTADGTVPNKSTAPPLATFGAANSVTLLGNGGLGNRAADKSDDQRINLTTSRVVTGKSQSGFAWAVIDESTKARVDLYEKNPSVAGAAVLRVGAPPIDGIMALNGLDKMSPGETDGPRLTSMANSALFPGVDRDKFKIYGPDLTVHSASLMTDVVSGGFKKDLSIWFSKGLTAAEKTGKLYRDSKSLTSTYPADPTMALLGNYHQYYNNINKKVGTVTPAVGGVVAKLPAGYTPFKNSDIAYPAAPTEPVMVPSILRVDLIFSMIARDVHGGREGALKAAGRPYMLHLQYLPVVTIHNPYNVPLSVEGLKVTFRNVPIGFQFLVDGQAVSNGLVPMNQFYSGSDTNPGATKDFSCTLGSTINTTGANSPFVLKPGQTKLFGTPKVAPTWTWQDESPGAGADGIALFDWRNDKTADFQITPKLMTPPTVGAGFDVDWINPKSAQTAAGVAVSNNEGLIALKGTEKIGVNYGPFAPAAGNGSFTVKVQLKQGTSLFEAGAFSMRYTNAARLKTIVEQGTSVRFPTARSFPETYPKSPADKVITVNDIYEPKGKAIKDYLNPKPFVIFSVGSRTTKESFVPTRIAADGNPVMNVSNIDLSTGKDPIGGVPLEIVMMPIRNGNAAIEDLRTTEEGYAFGGNGSLNGSTRATFYELPRGPLQSIAQLRHANLAGSGYMPLTTYTAGESRAHPQIGTDKVNKTWTDGSMMLDHTWLANESLWDRYFFSTIANQTSPLFSSTKAYTDVMKEFFALTNRLPNQRFTPIDQTTKTVPKALQDSTTPQDIVAASLLLQGGFNVNSTSVDAWIAVLSALRKTDIETEGGIDRGKDKYSPFPRVRRPVGKDIDNMTLADRASRWEGYRCLSDSTIQDLAKEITSEIRKRGPFLSLADFVNRGVGSDSDETNVKGAIQAAIDHIQSINQMPNSDGIDLGSGQLGVHGYQSVQAALGNTATAAPGAVTQGDILTGLGSRITVRADTFRIRAYGESRDASGKNIVARAWCEAIVQRMPEYVDPKDPASTPQAVVAPGATGTVNEIFGRRYQVLTFRWLSPAEV